MGVVDRFQRAFESTLGQLFTGLVCVLAILAIAYAIVLWRTRRRDILKYRYENFYRHAESFCKAFHFVGIHKAGFFGRVSPVIFPDRTYGLCTIPPPDIVDEEVRERYRLFQRATSNHNLPLFAPHLWSYDNEMVISVQGRLLQHDGCPLVHLQHYLLDKRLGRAYTEEILVNVARGLAALHNVSDDRGQKLYHGFILPRSLFIDFDVNRAINNILVSDLSLAFSLGPEKVYQQISALRGGKLAIEKYAARDLLEQLSMLSPEQKDHSRLDTVGPAADFYAYGALATVIFTQEPFRDYRSVSWTTVPKKWRSFLQSCLDDNPKGRPKDFLELEDWLTDPELALTIGCRDIDVDSIEDLPEEEETSLDDLLGVYQEACGVDQETEESSDPFTQSFDAGLRSLKIGRWKVAQEHFSKALILNPDHAEAQVSMAIACYEMGDLERAENFYNQAKNIDPTVAKCFREHIAFRV